MINGNAPCKGCKDRVVEPNCHMACEKYLEFVKNKEEYKEKERKYKLLNAAKNSIK